MSLLFATNTISDMVVVTPSRIVDIVPPNLSYIETDYTSTAIRIEASGDVPLMAYFDHAESVGKYWFHTYMRVGSNYGDNRMDGYMWYFKDANGVLLASVDVNDGFLRAGSHGTANVYGSQFNPGNGAINPWDVSVDLSGTTIVVDVFQGGVLKSTATATKTGAQTLGISTVEIYFADQGFGPSFDGYHYMSQIIVRDGDEATFDMNLKEILINAQGTYNDWSGTVSDINDRDNSTAAFTFNTLQKTSYTYPAVTVPITESIKEFVVNYNGIATGATIGTLTPFLRIGGVDYTTGSSINVAGPNPLPTIFLTDPSTDLGWTATSVSAVEVGIESGV